MTNEIGDNFNRQTDRIEYIDGIRGVASILVILCHLACVFLPFLYFSNKATTVFAEIWIKSPLNVLTNGNTAVQCFFVLSGFLISRKLYNSQQLRITSPIKQYGKLLRVVLPAALFAALLMVTGLMFHLKASSINANLEFVNGYNNFTPTLKNTLSDIFYYTFLESSAYVGPFWTIRYEFFGSILITAIAYFAAKNKKIAKESYIFIGIIFLSISPNLASFVLGAFAFDCIDRLESDDSIIGRAIKWILLKKWLLIIVLVIGIYFACTNMYLTGLWSPLQYLPDFIKGNGGAIRGFGVSLILICMERIKLLQNIFSIKPLKWLGKISAYTYAFHWPIILSVGCGVYLLLSNTLNYNLSVGIVSIVVIVITFLLAWLYIKLLPAMIKFETFIFNKIKALSIKRKNIKTV